MTSLSKQEFGPDYWLPIDEKSIDVDVGDLDGLHVHPRDAGSWCIEGQARYGYAREVLVDDECTGLFVVTQDIAQEPDVPVRSGPMTLAQAVSLEVFGTSLVRVGRRLQAGPEPTVDILEALVESHPSGGARLDVEPDCDPVLLLDYEALEDYQPTSNSIAEDLAAINAEHALGLDDLVEQARQEARANDDLAGTWEEPFIHALVAQGWVVYASHTRLAAYRFGSVVHEFLTEQAPSTCEAEPVCRDAASLRHGGPFHADRSRESGAFSSLEDTP